MWIYSPRTRNRETDRIAARRVEVFRDFHRRGGAGGAARGAIAEIPGLRRSAAGPGPRKVHRQWHLTRRGIRGVGKAGRRRRRDRRIHRDGLGFGIASPRIAGGEGDRVGASLGVGMRWALCAAVARFGAVAEFPTPSDRGGARGGIRERPRQRRGRG